MELQDALKLRKGIRLVVKKTGFQIVVESVELVPVGFKNVVVIRNKDQRAWLHTEVRAWLRYEGMKLQVEYQEGDLFEALLHTGGVVIPHVVNSVGAWGAGFVVPLGRKFPQAMESYRKWFKEKEWAALSVDPKVAFKLGNTIIPQVCDNDDNIIFVANMLAQDGLPSGAIRQPLQYDALEKCIKEVGEFAKKQKLSIYCPLFGAGIGGGKWVKIEALIGKHWTEQGIHVTCFYLKDKMPSDFHPPP